MKLILSHQCNCIGCRYYTVELELTDSFRIVLLESRHHRQARKAMVAILPFLEPFLEPRQTPALQVN